ncbi:hypothetical protein DSL72_005042 [Monilinia vaccinii-corymbosi]|uniref:Cellulase n=1 Tax=Monilinia vaccinii-corymbosi TaxID=61207 RepID=A0A8A3PEJ0_9HELO|nr:hypothetical protein DSL72_005042 [Monilinia vaccinii-corymbosi]
MVYNDPVNSAAVAAAFIAAASAGFNLFSSFDYTGNGPWPMDRVISYILTYRSHGAYFRYNGQPFVSTFERPASAADWIEIKRQIDCFFMPDWSSLGAKVAMEQANGVADGLFSWDAWPWGANDMKHI